MRRRRVLRPLRKRFLRFYDILRQSSRARHPSYVPFDVKSITSFEAGRQLCIADGKQHTDTTEDVDDAKDAEEVEDGAAGSNSTNTSGKLFVEAPIYGFLDPCDAPYRMPIGYPREALRRVRRCVLFGEPAAFASTGPEGARDLRLDARGAQGLLINVRAP